MTAAHIRLGEGTPPAPSAGEGILYFDSGDQQLYAIDAAGVTVGPITGGGGGGGGITAANVVYVQTSANGGNDGTGTRGDSSKPFATVSAALAAAQNGDVVLVGAGAFVGPGDLNVANPTLDSISIIGQGPKDTVFTSPGAEVFLVDYATNLVAWQSFVLARCSVVGTGFGTIFQANGTGSGGTFFPAPTSFNFGGLCLFDVDVSQNAAFPNVFAVGACAYVRMERVYQRTTTEAVSLFVGNVGTGIFRDCLFSEIIDGLNFGSPSAPPVTCDGSRYERVEAGTVLLGGQSRTVWLDCTVTTQMKDDKFSVAGVPLQGPQVRVQGGSIAQIDLGTTTFQKIPDDGAAQMLFDFSGVLTNQVLAEVAFPAVNRRTVFLRGCTITGSVDARDGVDVDAKTSAFLQSRVAGAFVTGATTGTILPPYFDLPVVATVASPGVATAAFGFSLPAVIPNGYAVLLESDNPADGCLAATNKTAISVGIAAAVGNSGNATGMVYIR